MVLGKVSRPGRPTNLDNSMARAYCACNRCGWGLFRHFDSPLSFRSFHFSFSLSLRDGLIKTEKVSQRAVNSKQLTNLLN